MAQTIIRLPEVIARTGLRKSFIYSEISQGNFPKSVKLSRRAVGWVESEIDEWIAQRIKQRTSVDMEAEV